jgi:hypothetical protein
VRQRNEDGLTHYLNVDLDILSRSSLEPLVAAFGQRVLSHYVGREGKRYGAHLSLAIYPEHADKAIRVFVALVKRLPARARRLWDKAQTRDFNIGVDAGFKPQSYELPLAIDIVRAVADVRGRIVFTVYAPEVPQRRGEAR